LRDILKNDLNHYGRVEARMAIRKRDLDDAGHPDSTSFDRVYHLGCFIAK